MSKPVNEDGLRERKRAALQAAIERTALDLVLEHGYENLTVEMICDASMVSQRTFFNYFGSKEGVILGAKPPVPSTEEIEKFTRHTGSNILADFVAMITAAMTDVQPDPELFQARRLLIQRTPELFDRQLARMAEAEDEFVNIVLDRLRGNDPDTAGSADFEDEARMVVALATGVMRYALRKRFSDDFSGSSRDLIDESIELIQRITGKSA